MPTSPRSTAKTGHERHRLDAAGRADHPRRQAAGEPDEIQDAHGAALGEPERDQAVRHVIGAALRRLAAGQPPQHQHEAGVEERHDEDEHHEHRRAHEGDLGANDRHERRGAEERPDEQAPESPMKSRAGGRFQNRKPGQRAGEHDRAEHEAGAERRASSTARKSAAMNATPAARPVHVVEQVDRVAQPREPDGGHQRVGQRHRACGRQAGEQEDEERADRQRRHQLGERRQLQPIVHDADAAHRQRRQQHRVPTARRKSTTPSRTRPMAKATIVAPAIATPPMVGVGWLCQRSGRGGTTAPIDAESQRITEPRRIERTSAVRKAPTSGPDRASDPSAMSISSRRDR
jgi:hypothetical protein